jgi:hypothetical protein
MFGWAARPVRHSQDATFALRATARPQEQGRAIAKRRREEGLRKHSPGGALERMSVSPNIALAEIQMSTLLRPCRADCLYSKATQAKDDMSRQLAAPAAKLSAL